MKKRGVLRKHYLGKLLYLFINIQRDLLNAYKVNLFLGKTMASAASY